MAKTYNTFTNVSTGDVYTASSHNAILTNLGNHRVPPYVQVRLTANKTYTENTNISWDAQVHDTDDMWTSGADVTINTAGIYLVTFHGRATATGSAACVPYMILGTGDGSDYQIYMNGPSTSDARWAMSAVRALSVNDKVYGRLQWSGSGTITLQGTGGMQPTLTATWLGQVS